MQPLVNAHTNYKLLQRILFHMSQAVPKVFRKLFPGCYHIIQPSSTSAFPNLSQAVAWLQKETCTRAQLGCLLWFGYCMGNKKQIFLICSWECLYKKRKTGVTHKYPLSPIKCYQVGCIINFQILISLGSTYLQWPDLLFWLIFSSMSPNHIFLAKLELFSDPIL